jgi:hypothetical protein
VFSLPTMNYKLHELASHHVYKICKFKKHFPTFNKANIKIIRNSQRFSTAMASLTCSKCTSMKFWGKT